MCRDLIAEQQQRKTDIETEFAALHEQNYYTIALEKDMAALEKFRRLVPSTFERRPGTITRRRDTGIRSGRSPRA